MKNWILGVALLTMISVGAQAQQQQWQLGFTALNLLVHVCGCEK